MRLLFINGTFIIPKLNYLWDNVFFLEKELIKRELLLSRIHNQILLSNLYSLLLCTRHTCGKESKALFRN